MSRQDSSYHRITGELHFTQNLRKPNTRFDPDGFWPITVKNLDKAALAELEAAGISHLVKEGTESKAELGKYIQFKRKVKRNDGTKNPPPQVVNAEAEPFAGNIGYGSVGTVAFRTFPTRSGRGHDFEGVQILKLVPYEIKLFDAVKEADEEGDSPFAGAEA
jgi:hypothetical protein